jgi:hypothetical protein
MQRDASLTIRLSAATKAGLEAVAARDWRSLFAYLLLRLEEAAEVPKRKATKP